MKTAGGETGYAQHGVPMKATLNRVLGVRQQRAAVARTRLAEQVRCVEQHDARLRHAFEALQRNQGALLDDAARAAARAGAARLNCAQLLADAACRQALRAARTDLLGRYADEQRELLAATEQREGARIEWVGQQVRAEKIRAALDNLAAAQPNPDDADGVDHDG